MVFALDFKKKSGNMHVDINVMKNSEILSFDIQIVSSDDDNDIKDMMMLSGICQTGV